VFATKIGIEIFGTGIGQPMKTQSGLTLDLAQCSQVNAQAGIGTDDDQQGCVG
jgi:hypothetical protein